MTQIDFPSLLSLTLRQPVAAARQLIALNLPKGARWGAVVLVSALAGILAWITAWLVGGSPEAGESIYGQLSNQPLMLAGLQLVAMVFAAWLMAFVGRLLGGQGRFDDALVLAAWIEAVLMLVQMAQLLLIFVLPGSAVLLGLVAVFLSLHLMAQFTKALHDLDSGWKVLVAIIGTVFIIGFLLSFLAAAFGLFPEAAP